MIASKSEKTFQVFNYIFLSIIAILALYPFLDVIRISVSPPEEAARMGFRLLPKDVTWDAYWQVFKNEYIWLGYKNTLVRIFLGLPLQLTIMTMAAYALSKKSFPHRNFWTIIVVFTMFFQGGLVPSFLLIRSLHIDNTVWALILPRTVISFSMLIERNYFMSLPESLEESAKIDGAGILKILAIIIVPISLPILMTIGLWEIVAHWNAWFDCLIYIRESKKYVLQVILRKIVIEAAPQFSEMGLVDEQNNIKPAMETIKCATIIVSSLPILIVYPFIQKHFIKGIMVGSLKG